MGLFNLKMAACAHLLVLAICAVFLKDALARRYKVNGILELETRKLDFDTETGESRMSLPTEIEQASADVEGQSFAARKVELEKLLKKAKLEKLMRLNKALRAARTDYQKLWFGSLVRFGSCSEVTAGNFCTAKKPRGYGFLNAFINMLNCFGVETQCADFNARLVTFEKEFWNTRTGAELKSIAGAVDIKKYWFGTEALGAKVNIGFMHTFAGDPNSKAGQKYSGFHSWVQYYNQKCNNRIKNEVSSDTNPEPNDVKVCKNEFDWRAPGDGPTKFRTKKAKKGRGASSIPFGTTPEYDIAVLSLCFKKLGEEQGTCTVEMNGVTRKVSIMTKESDMTGSLIRTGFFSG